MTPFVSWTRTLDLEFSEKELDMTDLLVQALVEMKEAECCRERNRFSVMASPRWRSSRVAPGPWRLWASVLKKGVYFLPTYDGREMLKQISNMIKPLIQEQKTAGKAQVLIGTVEGDIHDIGKNIVVFLLEANVLRCTTSGSTRSRQNLLKRSRGFSPKSWA